MVHQVECEPAGPHQVAPWLEVNRGDGVLGERMDTSLPIGAVVLHQRALPDDTGRIDHLVVASTGVWIVDVNNTRQRAQRTDIGTRRRPEPRLYVAGRDRTNLLRVLSRHTDAVQALVGCNGHGPIPLHRVLCFTEASWRPFARPFVIEEVLVTTPKRLMSAIREHGPLDAQAVCRVGASLDRQLPHA